MRKSGEVGEEVGESSGESSRSKLEDVGESRSTVPLQVRRRVSQACESGPGLYGHASVLPAALTIKHIFSHTLVFTCFHTSQPLFILFFTLSPTRYFLDRCTFHEFSSPFRYLPGELSTVDHPSSRELFFRTRVPRGVPGREDIEKHRFDREASA